MKLYVNSTITKALWCLAHFGVLDNQKSPDKTILKTEKFKNMIRPSFKFQIQAFYMLLEVQTYKTGKQPRTGHRNCQ